MQEFQVASLLIQSKVNVIILLAGTSGTGKSTLASILGTRLGIQTVLSTDSIRHIMRNFLNEAENPILFCSTYEAGTHIPQDIRNELSESAITLKGYKQQAKLV
jgi:2-phosphoglycerate kinase